MWSQEDIEILILLIGMAAGVFAGFCPSWFTVSSPFFHEQDAIEGNIKRIRWGELAAAVIVIAVGWAISSRSKSNFGIYGAFGISVVFVGGYEYMIKHPATED